MSKIFANIYVPECVSENWSCYERDGLMTYFDQLKWKEFIFDPDAPIKNNKVTNFKKIHAQFRGTPYTHSDQFYQTVREKNVAKMPQKDRKKTVATCWRSERKDIFI